ncbi:MAG: hypothetical protein AB1938_23215 [Myxococcota bacterium]
MAPFLQHLQDYFRGERAEALYFIVPTGVALLGLAVVALRVERGGFALGMAIPLFVFGLFMLTVGLVVGLRTPKQVATLEAEYAASPRAMVQKELPRMRKVNANWPVYVRAYGILILLGLLLRFVTQADWARGVGPALVLVGALGFVIDGFAERRAHPYTEALESLAKETGATP